MIKELVHFCKKGLCLSFLGFCWLSNLDSIQDTCECRSIFKVTLVDGKEVPVCFACDELNLHNGKEPVILDPNAVIEVSCQGGLRGLINRNAEEVDFDLAFIQDRYLRVRNEETQAIVNIPWDLVVSISQEIQAILPDPEEEVCFALVDLFEDKEEDISTEAEEEDLEEEEPLIEFQIPIQIGLIKEEIKQQSEDQIGIVF